MPASASISRRQLLRGRPLPAPFEPRPPGAVSLDACTGCGDCVSACPQQILSIAQDRVILLPRDECTFCGECARACPEPVFGETRIMGHLVAISGDCLTHAGISCMTCRDTCPEDAISMRPRIGGPFLPEIDGAACTGCGACIAPCPNGAIGIIERNMADAE